MAHTPYCSRGHSINTVGRYDNGTCKLCHKFYTRLYRKRNPNYEKDKKKARREWINTYKDIPCTDCGIKYPTYVMQFDHVNPKTKSFSIALGVTSSKDKIVQEIKKCEVVCANCHAIRTYRRRHGTY